MSISLWSLSTSSKVSWLKIFKWTKCHKFWVSVQRDFHLKSSVIFIVKSFCVFFLMIRHKAAHHKRLLLVYDLCDALPYVEESSTHISWSEGFWKITKLVTVAMYIRMFGKSWFELLVLMFTWTNLSQWRLMDISQVA